MQLFIYLFTHSIHPSIHHLSLHPYVDLHGDVFAASVALDFEDLREDHDDAVLGLSESAVKRNPVHNCLKDERGRQVEISKDQILSACLSTLTMNHCIRL